MPASVVLYEDVSGKIEATKIPAPGSDFVINVTYRGQIIPFALAMASKLKRLLNQWKREVS